MAFCFAALALMAGCATVPSSKKAEVASNSIAYYQRPGTGPTVVFQAGLGDGKDVWGKVIGQLPGSLALFAYDRPGYGDSPLAQDKRSPCAISRELHALLKAAKVAPPYLLVGHSLGGLDQLCFATLYPHEVAGMVLLDPTYPHHWSKMQVEAPLSANILKSLRLVAFSSAMKQEFDAQEDCLTELDLKQPLTFPTRLLFSTEFRPEELGSYQQFVKALRKQWPNFFTQVQSSEVSGSGHYIQKDAPETVVQAIEKVLGESQASHLARR
ncbi:alpha/beta hydrolase [Gallaecimonas kandeliae]|uniref:alpha/beta fold hydrolase n=1 Tax=Gallaecimonas kandeliae TaxID=3029055 RepID=UPI0026492346|nr:alpha/beta hydrolase [Gallaecimonas kandeliae]WKE64044.1 alpha/beta hydrolase [Gallaecimonas kandeliae]